MSEINRPTNFQSIMLEDLDRWAEEQSNECQEDISYGWEDQYIYAMGYDAGIKWGERKAISRCGFDTLKENTVYTFTIREVYKRLFTSYVEGGYTGKVFQQDEEHVYIKKFLADNTGKIHYGFVERMPWSMIADIVEVE